MSRLHSFNHTLRDITLLPKQDSISSHHNISGITGDGTEHTANGAGVLLTISVISDHDMQTDKAGDATTAASCLIHNTNQLVAVGFDTDQSPSTGQIASSRHSFTLRDILNRLIVALQISRQILLTSARLLVSAQIDTILLALIGAMMLSAFVSH
jgi:hypothetical protein